MLALFLNTSKGFFVLDCLVKANLSQYIIGVVSYNDNKTNDNSYTLIKELCFANQISFFEKNGEYDFKDNYKLAIGWQYLINDLNKLFIIHDSLLPKYRGFAPTVNALINGEKKIGASLIQSSKEYDKGDIYRQEEILLKYPIKILDVINLLEVAYSKLTIFFLKQIISCKPIFTTPQLENDATYSLWRNNDDYFINWSWSASKIKRFIDAVGKPFDGAKTTLKNKIYIIEEVEVLEDVKIENRVCGKQIFLIEKCPVIVCGKGLIKLKIVKNEKGSLMLFKQFRNHFK